jgi:hypothetical protein
MGSPSQPGSSKVGRRLFPKQTGPLFGPLLPLGPSPNGPGPTGPYPLPLHRTGYERYSPSFRERGFRKLGGMERAGAVRPRLFAHLYGL